MPLTVITLKNVPQSLRGDLTKWMQEIATGVYVGNFNARVREHLWERVRDSIGIGEATLSFFSRNEIGYGFDTINAQRKVIDFDGIPLVLLPAEQNEKEGVIKFGFSNAAKNRKIRKFSFHSIKIKKRPYVVIDIETDGLNEYADNIIEIGALKISGSGVQKFSYLIKCEKTLPKSISDLTGITQQMLDKEGVPLAVVLQDFLKFVGELDIIGYNLNFDIQFLNNALKKWGLPILSNKKYDLLKYVKSEKLFLKNYKLKTVLQDYGIETKVEHRALSDAKLTYELSTKVNKFQQIFNRR